MPGTWDQNVVLIEPPLPQYVHELQAALGWQGYIKHGPGF